MPRMSHCLKWYGINYPDFLEFHLILRFFRSCGPFSYFFSLCFHFHFCFTSPPLSIFSMVFLVRFFGGCTLDLRVNRLFPLIVHPGVFPSLSSPPASICRAFLFTEAAISCPPSPDRAIQAPSVIISLFPPPSFCCALLPDPSYPSPFFFFT